MHFANFRKILFTFFLSFYTELIKLAMTSCDMSKLIDIQRKKAIALCL